MVNKCHIKIIRESTSAWNAWRRTHPNEPPDLEGFDFTDTGTLEDPYDAYLQDVDLRHANLKAANLSSALLTSARFENADLTGANLSGSMLKNARVTLSILKYADLSNANLQGCNLSRADLTRSILNCAVLSDAVLYGCCLDGTILKNLDLSKTRGLHRTEFDQPPDVDEQTLEKTRAGLAHFPFLRLEIEEFSRNIMKNSTP